MRIIRVCCLISLLFAGVIANAQDAFRVTEYSAHYIPPATLDSITATTLKNAAHQNGIGPALFEERYNAYRPRIAELMKSFLLFSFREMDMRYRPALPEPGSERFQKIQQAYLSKVNESLKRILETPASVHPLLESDQSDRILYFNSALKVDKSGHIEVTETIRIFNGEGGILSDNDEIKRGIVRDFPTKYRHQKGYWVNNDFKVKSVKLNGGKVNYSTSSLENGKRVQIGSEDFLLPKGIYTYELIYETNRQLIFHEDRDELYWNVNGNGWTFRFDTVIASIEFPETSIIGAQQCYTGVMGSTMQECAYTRIADHKIEFRTIKGLKPYEGLTIAADIQKGILTAPGPTDNLLNFLRSNWIVPLLTIILVLLTGYYWSIWRKKGKDPEKGTIYPQFQPPYGLRPADVGYILQQKFGSHLFVASLVDAAVQKQLEIEVNKGGWMSSTEYSFKQIPQISTPSPAVLMQQYGFNVAGLYGLEIKSGKYNSTLKTLYNSLETQLKNRFLKQKNLAGAQVLFSLNRGYLFLGSFLLFLCFGASIIFLALNFTLPLLIFIGVALLLLLILLIVFYKILPSYTVEGRKIADQIEGFKMYLSHAEQKRFDALAPPDKTLALFERFLPYAIALKVENEWAEQFDSILKRALEQGYRPTYFHAGRGFAQNLQFADLTRGVSSGLSSTISSSSTPPSSSSGGSRGGGSSGGGGGGGGGGGW